MPDATATQNDVVLAVFDYQRLHGLKPDGIPGPVTQHHLDLPRFCGLPDRIQTEGAGLCQWPPNHKPTVAIADYTPGLSRTDQREAVAFVLAETAKLCGLKAELLAENSGQRANVTLYAKHLGGRGGTLAQAQLPCGANANTQLFLESDSAELWAIFDGPSTNGRIDWRRVFWHEFNHNIGLEHGPSGNLNAPVYSEAIWTPRAWDIAQLKARYGEPRDQPTPTPTPPAADKSWTVLELTLKAQASAMGYRLTKLA